MIAPLLIQLAILLVIGSALASALATAARHHWVAELFSHFRLHYLLAQIPLAVLLPAWGEWPWAIVAILSAAPNLRAVVPYLPGLVRHPPDTASAGAIRPCTLVAANLLYNQNDPRSMRDYLRDCSPDLLILAEFTPGWRAALAALEQDYPWHVLRPRSGAWGIAVYSRYPVAEAGDLDLGDDRSSHLRVRVVLPAGLVELYAVHLASPLTGPRAAQRNRQLEALSARVAASDPALPKIVAGDLNLTPWSPHFTRLLSDAGLRDARRPYGPHATWPVALGPLGIPIDHCLAGPGMRVSRVRAGTRAGSDHFPLECDILPGS